MKRILCSMLVACLLLAGLIQPVLAAQEPQTLLETEPSEQTAEQPETTERTGEPTQAPTEAAELTEATEATEPTEAESPTERPQTRAPEKMTVSEQGVAFINEMMSGSYGGSWQLSSAADYVNQFAATYDLSLTQTQFDALADLVMAYGEYILTSGYQVEKVIASGSYSDVQLANAFCAWVKSGESVSQQHLARRLREVKLFLYGSYDGNCETKFRYLIFNANGGKLGDNSVLCYTYNLPYGLLPSATRAGYYFTGWYTAASGGVKLLETSIASDNHTLYARWSTEKPDTAFRDVAADAWYYTFVSQAVAKELFNGVGDGLFAPDSSTTRAMLTTVLWRFDGKKEATAASFTDVSPDAWYAPAVNWATEAGVVNGIGDGLFGQDGKITREQLVTMLYRYAQSREDFDTQKTTALTGYRDAASVSSYALEAIEWAVASGVMNGDGGLLRPQGNATRAECAKLLICFLALQTGDTPTPDPDPAPDPAPDPLPDPPELRISESGVQFIKDHEGFIQYAMWDYSQWSIGYGTRCEKDEFPNGITEEEADYRLRLMLADFEKNLNALETRFGRTFRQQEYDALLSFTFNLGAGWMSSTGSDTYKMLQSGSYTEMEFVNTLGRWIHAGGQPLDGLARRRMDEANLYLNGEYTLGCTKYLRVTYNANEGTCEKNFYYYRTGETFGELPVPSREGYTFAGWFDRLSGGEQYTAETTVPAYGNYTLYARWQAVT